MGWQDGPSLNPQGQISLGYTGVGQDRREVFGGLADLQAQRPNDWWQTPDARTMPQAQEAKMASEKANRPGPNASWIDWAEHIRNYFGVGAVAELARQGVFNPLLKSPEDQQNFGAYVAARQREVNPDDIFGGNMTRISPGQAAQMFVGGLFGAAAGGAGAALGSEAGTGTSVGADAAMAGGGEVGSGYAASAPGWAGSSGTTGFSIGDSLATGGNTSSDFIASGAEPQYIAQYSTPSSVKYGFDASGQWAPTSSTPAMTFSGEAPSWAGGQMLEGSTLSNIGTGASTNFSSLEQQPQQNPSEIGMEQPAPNYGPSEIPPNYGATNSVPPSGGGSAGPSGGGASSTGFGWNPQTVQAGLNVAGGLYSIYNYEQQKKMLQDQQAKSNAAMDDAEKLRQMQMGNWDLVDQYLRDPMALLRNNPGYLASVDFVDKEGRRMAAKGGYNVSGNKVHYLADILGKNAESWYNKAWAPIRDAAGLGRPDQTAQLAQGGLNATNQINQLKNNMVHTAFDAGTRAIPSLFKLFGSETA